MENGAGRCKAISRTKCVKRKRIFTLILFCILLLFLFAFDTRLKIRYYTVRTEKMGESVRIVLVTDLHSCKYGREEEKLIAAIEEQKPDMVLLGGDICDDKIPNDNTEALLKGIADSYPCYYVTGNHEYWSNRIDKILDLFQSYGVTVLSGTSDIIKIRSQSLNICGISDPDIIRYTDSPIGAREQLQTLEHVPDNGLYTILLAHRPEWIDTYAEYDFDLVLSGHAHGGQWRLPGIINGVFAPDQGMFPKYAGGRYISGDMTMIVSRGLARESTPIPRIFNRPELVVVDLEPSG